jgi:hypothetical protein
MKILYCCTKIDGKQKWYKQEMTKADLSQLFKDNLKSWLFAHDTKCVEIFDNNKLLKTLFNANARRFTK